MYTDMLVNIQKIQQTLELYTLDNWNDTKRQKLILYPALSHRSANIQFPISHSVLNDGLVFIHFRMLLLVNLYFGLIRFSCFTLFFSLYVYSIVGYVYFLYKIIFNTE